MENDMDRLNAYSSPAPDGKGVRVDVHGMMLDLITILKANSSPKEEAVAKFGEMWDEVQVTIKIPKTSTN